MSHGPAADVKRLGNIASELREVLAERGYRVEKALEVDPAFGADGRRSGSDLSRDLAVDAIARAAAQVQVDCLPVNGEGRELRIYAKGLTRRYRIRKAEKTAAGLFRIKATADPPQEPEDLFGREEHWVFAYVLDPSYQAQEIFVAPILGVSEGKFPYLVLGSPIVLDDSGPFVGGFTPDEESLDDFLDDESEGEDIEDDAGESNGA